MRCPPTHPPLPTHPAAQLVEMLPNKESAITDHMRDLIQKFVDKGLLEFTYVHHMLWEYTQELVRAAAATAAAAASAAAAPAGGAGGGEGGAGKKTRMDDLVRLPGNAPATPASAHIQARQPPSPRRSAKWSSPGPS